MKGLSGLAFEFATTSDKKLLNLDKWLRKL